MVPGMRRLTCWATEKLNVPRRLMPSRAIAGDAPEVFMNDTNLAMPLNGVERSLHVHRVPAMTAWSACVSAEDCDPRMRLARKFERNRALMDGALHGMGHSPRLCVVQLAANRQNRRACAL